MKKVPLATWGGTKVRNRMKVVWDKTLSLGDVAQADTDFGQYQQALATTVENTNELIDWKVKVESDLARRPF